MDEMQVNLEFEVFDFYRSIHRRKFGREPSKEYHIEFGPVVVQKNFKM
jgi:hypothetical protein